MALSKSTALLEIESVEAEVLKAMAAIGLTSEELTGVQLSVGDYGIGWIGTTDKITDILLDGRRPTDDEPVIASKYVDPMKPEDNRINLAYACLMLWACCQYIRKARKPDPWAFLAIGEAFAYSRLALRFPEITVEVLHEISVKRGSKGAYERSRKLKEQRAPIQKEVDERVPRIWDKNPLLDKEGVKLALLEEYPDAKENPPSTLNTWISCHDHRGSDERRGPKPKQDK